MPYTQRNASIIISGFLGQFFSFGPRTPESWAFFLETRTVCTISDTEKDFEVWIRKSTVRQSVKKDFKFIQRLDVSNTWVGGTEETPGNMQKFRVNMSYSLFFMNLLNRLLCRRCKLVEMNVVANSFLWMLTRWFISPELTLKLGPLSVKTEKN